MLTMSTSLATMIPTHSTTATGSGRHNDNENSSLFASVDMGTNSFKLFIVRADPFSGRFLTLDCHKEQVLLGLEATSTISPDSQLRAVTVLQKFQDILRSRRVPTAHSRHVATSAVRESANQTQFLDTIHANLGIQVDVLSGFDEARLTYLGVLQFLPIRNNTILTIDIGGGSTEFVIGHQGKILYSTSLKLGHVTLTKTFPEVESLREHIRRVISASDLTSKVKEYNIEKVTGSSGTIRHIEKAILSGYALSLEGNIRMFDELTKKWCFSKEELKQLVEMLVKEDREVGGNIRKESFFKSRSGFIKAGAILLEEIFNILGIEEMEVSEYALGEGVIAEKLEQVYEGHTLKYNVGWQSVVRLATRFNSQKRMESAAASVGIAKEIFEGLSKWYASRDDGKLELLLVDKDLEYLEVACLLHNIGRYTGKKAYHKHSYHIIMNGDHLHGYTNEEVKFIALLVRHHRKKFPKSNALSAAGVTDEVKQKFKILCTIIRLSTIVRQYHPGTTSFLQVCDSQEGFKLVLGQLKNQPNSGSIRPSSAEEINLELAEELEYFRQVHQKNLSIVFPTET